jgi:hypothetical protein
MSPGFVPESILTRLVLRGMNASAAILDEAETYGDTVFVQADAGLSLNRGPLMSTLLWLRCAVEAWPHADLIGKAEDDSWVHLHEVERLLRSALGGMAQMGVAHLYWGTRYETYHWNATAQRPLGFGRPWAVYGDHYLERKVTTHGPNAGSFVGGPKCSPITPDSPFHGPFPYQKGQLYFLDGGLSRRVCVAAARRPD